MHFFLSVLFFILILFFYIHLQYQYKTSDDLEIYELDYTTNQQLQEICHLKQPVLFQLDQFKDIEPFFEMISLKNNNDKEDVNIKVVAERTPGFSGADLHSVMNEGAILAARENRKKVFQYDLIRAIEKVMLGPERKSHLLSKK
jgi:AAA+ superfamily predicted ATPase